jgi:hypothetical protein
MGEIAAHTGERIAGAEVPKAFRDASRVAAEYGGDPNHWVKMSSSGFRAADRTAFQTHWIENIMTGQQVEMKVTIDVLGGQ